MYSHSGIVPIKCILNLNQFEIPWTLLFCFWQEKICANYNRIKLRPEKFIDYLLSDEVGFAAYEVLEQQQAKFQGTFFKNIHSLTPSMDQTNFHSTLFGIVGKIHSC